MIGLRMLPPNLRVDYGKAEEVITKFIKDVVRAAGVEGVVIGLSGGGDSAVTAALAVKALGPERVKVLYLPDMESDPQSALIANKVADNLGLELHTINITPAVKELLRLVGLTYGGSDKVVRGNVKVRTRMTMLYAIANNERRLVLGTSDRSEWLIGYFTKWGDGSADAYPIIGLYKSQVREFGKYLGLPIEVTSRPPTPDLWPGHTAEGELGITYDLIDQVLYYVFDEGMRPEDVPKVSGVPMAVVDRVIELHERSKHKREPLNAPFMSFKELKQRFPR
ncbi:MAG: NAD+ synthase [Desulfurococcales archaeon]|nr:NAD+ synthase [Desulfurococcales archaeon]